DPVLAHEYRVGAAQDQADERGVDRARDVIGAGAGPAMDLQVVDVDGVVGDGGRGQARNLGVRNEHVGGEIRRLRVVHDQVTERDVVGHDHVAMNPLDAAVADGDHVQAPAAVEGHGLAGAGAQDGRRVDGRPGDEGNPAAEDLAAHLDEQRVVVG